MLAGFFSAQTAFGLLLPSEAFAHSRQAALKALELDEKLPQAHGMAASVCAWQFAK